MNFIGIDTGRNATKVVSATTTTFPSIVGTARNLRLESAADIPGFGHRSFRVCFGKI